MSVLGIDIATSGTKVILLDDNGQIAANVSEEYPTSSPHPMWSEQEPEAWWRATCQAIRRALAESNTDPAQVKGLSFSGQMVGLVALDEKCKVIRPCILWNDQRSAEVTAELTGTIGLEKILEETSNPLFATFVAPKLVWMRRHEPANYKRIRHVLLPKDYVAFRLTGVISTEVSDASGTCLLNVRERKWSQVMVNAMEVPEEWLPPCTESDDIVGTVTRKAAEESGLAEGAVVVAGAGDQPAQALGSGIVKPGLCSVTIGTSGVVFAQSDGHIQHPNGLLHSFCHSVRGQWYLMGVMLSAGGSYQWLRNALRGLTGLSELSYDDLNALAAKAPAGAEGLIFLPYLTGERCPYDDPHARGALVGLTQRHGPGHIARAVMEGISFGLCDSVSLMRKLGTRIERVYASGGAARSVLWRQMLADVFQTEIVTTNVVEGGALGAAMLAGIGTGRYKDAVEAAEALIEVTGTTSPDGKASERYRQSYGIYRSLYPTLRDTFQALSGV